MQVFNSDALLNGHNFIIGDGRGKDRVVRDLINNHDPRNGALVVLDYDGKLYESYNGKAMLADFSSSGSVLSKFTGNAPAREKVRRGPKDIFRDVAEAPRTYKA